MSVICGKCRAKVEKAYAPGSYTYPCKQDRCPAGLRQMRPVAAEAKRQEPTPGRMYQDPELRCIEQAATLRRILGATDQELAPEAAHRVRNERDDLLIAIERALEFAAWGDTGTGWMLLRQTHDQMRGQE